MSVYLSIALGGALGAVLRYWLSGVMQALTGSALPVGTLTVNALGSFILGAVMLWSTERFLIPVETRLLLTTGLCGSLTTFSTFSYETLMLIGDQQWGAAAGNVALNAAICLGAVALGVVAARLV